MELQYGKFYTLNDYTLLFQLKLIIMKSISIFYKFKLMLLNKQRLYDSKLENSVYETGYVKLLHMAMKLFNAASIYFYSFFLRHAHFSSSKYGISPSTKIHQLEGSFIENVNPMLAFVVKCTRGRNNFSIFFYLHIYSRDRNL